MSEDRDENAADDQTEDGFLVKFGKCICCPIILLYYSIAIYCCGCIFAKCEDCLHTFQKCCCGLCACLFCGGCGMCAAQFVDKDFEPSVKSLGSDQWGAVEWMPAEEVVVENAVSEARAAGKELSREDVDPQFVEGGLRPHDVSQGALGDCYLMSAMSAVAEFPGVMRKVTQVSHFNPYGKYVFRFYNANPDAGRFEDIEVDTLVPTVKAAKGVPIFCKPNGNEMAIMLLEKAAAKFCGDYNSMDGGSTAWALTFLTGNPTFVFDLDEKTRTWKKWNSIWRGNEQNKRKSNLSRSGNAPAPFDHAAFRKLLIDYTERDSIMCCSVHQGSSDREKNRGGLPCRHAYTLRRVFEMEGITLCQIRNPWGSGGEWKGKWSDNDAAWNQHSSLKKKLVDDEGGFKDDGMFFIEWADFCENFGGVSVCTRETGFGDLVLEVDESSICPVCKGCMAGCGDFWCCCKGCKALCCATKRAD